MPSTKISFFCRASLLSLAVTAALTHLSAQAQSQPVIEPAAAKPSVDAPGTPDAQPAANTQVAPAAPVTPAAPVMSSGSTPAATQATPAYPSTSAGDAAPGSAATSAPPTLVKSSAAAPVVEAKQSVPAKPLNDVTGSIKLPTSATPDSLAIEPLAPGSSPISVRSSSLSTPSAPLVERIDPSAPISIAPAPIVTSAIVEPSPLATSSATTGATTTTLGGTNATSILSATDTASETAPIIIPEPPADLWDRIRSGFAMTDLDDELVGKWEKYYASRPEYLARIVERSNKYMFYIVTELERRNMPLEIALLPMIESAFNPIANSSAKASGIWQFIPSTGTAFGMKQDWWADSRRDIVAATNGALDYLTKLNGMFAGDWQLSLASYNWGEGAVGRASARAKAAGRNGTYLTLSMPAETRNYLPKLQAVKNIIRNPAAFGLKIASIPNEPYFKTITLAHALDLKRAAQLADMTEADFVALNPAHNRPVIAGRGEFQILLPADRADAFLSRLESDAKPRVSWMAYRTRGGDRLEALAERFGTSVAALKSVNGIRATPSSLPAGYHLLVPSDGPSADALGSIQNAVFTKFPEYVAPRSHKVRKGETFAGIAKRYSVAPATLAKWNRMSKPSARAGQLLYVGGPAPVRSASKGVRSSIKAGRAVHVKKGGKGIRKNGSRSVARAGKVKAKKRRA